MLGLPVTILLASCLAFSPWTSGVAPIEPGGGDAFAKASMVPPSASFYLRAVDGRTLRREISSRPMGGAIAATVLDNAVLGAWRTLAKDLNCDEGELFDRLFGRDVTLAIRGTASGFDWALISAVDGNEIDRLLTPRQRDSVGRRGDGRALGAALGVSFLGGGWREFARQQVAAWHHDGVLVVAPAGQRNLGDEVVELIGATGGPRLGNDQALAEARALGGEGPRVEFFTRSVQPPGEGGSWTAAVAELRGRVVEIRRRSNLAAIDDPTGSTASPLSHALATLARDSASGVGAADGAKSSDVLDRLRDGGVVAFVEPLGDHGDVSEAIVAMAPGLFGVHGAELRLLRAIADGPTTMIVASKAVSELPAGSPAPPRGVASGGDANPASVALVTEIRNPMEAERLQERGLREREAACMATVMAGGASAGEFPSGSTASSGGSSASSGSSSPLYMQVITTARGRWKVVCNDAALLGRVVNELHAPADAHGTVTITARSQASVCGIGMLDGRGLAIQMRGLRGPMIGIPSSLEGGGAGRSIDEVLRTDRTATGGPDANDAVAPINEWVAEWASAIDTLRWVLSRPQPDRVELRATVELVDGDGVGDLGR